MTKDEILDYATQSPQNTNRAVLSGMLNALVGSEGGGGVLAVLSGYIYIEEDDDYVTRLNKTWQEIYDALSAGIPVFVYTGTVEVEDGITAEGQFVQIVRRQIVDDTEIEYIVRYTAFDDYGDKHTYTLYADGPNGYPEA